MRGVLTTVALSLVLTGAAAGAQSKAALRLTTKTPLALRGTHFHAKERVRVTVTVSGAKHSRYVRTTVAGAFTAMFTTVMTYDPCNEDLVATAAGARGDSALLKLPQRACPPSP